MTSSVSTQLQGEYGLRKILHQAPVAMSIVLGPDFLIHLANEKQLVLWQKDADEVIGRPLFAVFPEVASQGFREQLTQVFSTGVTFRGEEIFTQFHRNGTLSEAWFDFVYEPLRNDLGQVEGVMVVSTEVTDKVLTRRRLVESTERLHYTVKLSPNVHWTASSEGGLEQIDEKWRDLTGHPALLMLERGWEPYTHPDEHTFLREEWHRCVAQGEPYLVEHRTLMCDGTYRWMRSQAFPRKNGQGKVLRWYGCTEDIHEFRSAMEQLRHNEEKYRSLFERMNQGFCIVEVFFDETNRPVDYLFLECNERFNSQTGLISPVGRTARELLPGLEEHWFRIYGSVALSGCPQSFVEGSDVMNRWFEVYAYKLGGPESRKVAILFSDISDRKRDEAKLRQAISAREQTVSLLESLLHHAPLGFAFTDRQHRYTHINNVLAGINGIPAAAHPGKSIQEVLPQIGGQVLSFLEQVLHTGQAVGPVNIEEDTPGQSGVQRHWLANYYPVFAADGETVAQVGTVITDITDQKRAEQRIAASERRYHDIYSRAPVSIWEEDFSEVRKRVLELKKNGLQDLADHLRKHPDVVSELISQIRVLDVNAATLELYGGNKQQLLEGFPRVFVDETQEALIQELLLIAHGGGRYEAETVLRNFSGGLIDVLVRIDFPEHDDYSRVHVILFDITERKKAERIIRDSEARFRNLADNAPVMIWITDQKGYCHYLNRQWYDFTGQRIEEGHGIGWTDAVHPDESAMAAQVFLDASRNEQPYRIEFRLRRWDGVYRWVIDSAVPRRDADGQFMGYIGSVVDIHDQKLFSEELERLARERTQALERSNIDLRQFAHVASHDLREPVRKVATFQSRLVQEFGAVLPPRARTYLAKIEKAARRSNDMIEGLLLSTTVESSKEPLQAVDLNALLEALLEDMDVVIELRRASISHNGLPVVAGIPILLYHLFHNLLQNALKFARADRAAQVEIQSEPVFIEGRPFGRISCRDYGIGFPVDLADAIFEPFKRLHSKDEYEGAGLGLAFCLQVAQRHGGRIWAEGSEGTGSVFIVELPLWQA